MRTRIGSKRVSALLLACFGATAAPAALAIDVRVCTTQGMFELELDERNAPLHARNFARYAEAGFYSGTVIHRVVPGSMVQGGGYDLSLERRRPGAPVASEASNGLSNRRGTIAASRSEDPGSATSQFFVNLADNTHLDTTPDSVGYTVFGRITAGLDVLDAISRLPVRRSGELAEVPVPLVELESVTVLDRERVFGLSVERDPAAMQAEFEAAWARGDAAATLAAIDSLRQGCIALDGRQHLAEAEAAIELGRTDRARYGLEQYLARAASNDPLLASAQRLYAGLPSPAETGFEERIAHCREPSAPSIPSRAMELATLQIIEGEVRRYRQDGEAYLDCIARVIDSGDLSEPEAIDATDRYNETVIGMTAVVTRYNQAVRAFSGSQ